MNSEKENPSSRMNERVISDERIEIPPVKKERIVTVAKPTVIESVSEIRHTQYIERIEELNIAEKRFKQVNVPKVEVRERIIQIPKPIKEEKIIEVPHVQIVDKIVEVTQHIPQEKIVEIPRKIIQERVIPLPNRVIEETVVEVPKEEFEKILQLCEDLDGQPESSQLNDTVQKEFSRPNVTVEKSIDENHSGNKEVYEIPHLQRIYKNTMQPVCRHIPQPVEVPLAHYKPIPVVTIIDRNVPIPVELEVVQEFICPRIIEKYSEVLVPILVNRAVEKAVPADAMFNSSVMEAYLNGQGKKEKSLNYLYRSNAKVIPKNRMTESELHKRGLNTQLSLSQMKTFKSGEFRGDNNLQASENFFNKNHSIAM